MSGDNLLGVREGCQNLVEGWVKTTGPAKGKTVPTWSIRKLQLGLPGRTSGGDIPPLTRLDGDEMPEVMNRCGAPQPPEVPARALTVSDERTEWLFHQDLVEGFRQAFIAEFGGTVLADRIRPNAPNRGKNWVAEIVLKPCAQSKKQRTMQLSGERMKAMEDVQSGLQRRRLNRGRDPGAPHAFPSLRRQKGNGVELWT